MIPTETTTASRLRRLPLVVVLAAGLGAGAACSGSGSGNDGVASIKTASDKKKAGADDAKDQKNDKAPEDAFLDFARCMREHGIDMPDPDTSGGPGVVKFGAVASSAVSAGGQASPDMTKFEDANEACRDLLGDVGPQTMDPKQQQEMQDQALAFSKCMREHGIDMPDPNFSGQGTVAMKIGDGFDPGSETFQTAQQACGSAFGPAGATPGKGGPGGMISVSPGGGKGGGFGFSVGASSASSGAGSDK